MIFKLGSLGLFWSKYTLFQKMGKSYILLLLGYATKMKEICQPIFYPMIKKFIKIDGTGKFLNYNPSVVPTGYRTTDFEKVNLLYGENGSGKTTLSVLLQSLKGDNALLSKKRSFDRTVAQKIEVLTDITLNPKLTFANSTWDIHYPNIEIFDIHFINENIYTGLEIQNSHKKKLFEVIFGQQGITLKSNIQRIKDDIQTTNKEIRETTDKISIAIENSYTAIDYCNLPVDIDIDNKIKLKEAEIKTAKSFQEIQSKGSLSDIPMLTMPYENGDAQELLSQSIDNISDEYLDKFKRHKDHLGMDGKAEVWIKQGYKAIQDDSCPFCLRAFGETVEVLKAYKQYFNEEYNSLLESLSQINSSVADFNIEAQVLQIETKISTDLNVIEFWKNHIENPPALSSIISVKDGLMAAFNAVKNVFKEKSNNPIQSQPVTDINEFKKNVDSLNNTLNVYNTEIGLYNQKITGLKSLSQPNTIQLELELKKLKAIKKRDDTAVDGFCRKLTRDTQALSVLNNDKNTNQQLLDTYSAAVFNNYATKINLYLQAFAPYLEIRNLDSGYVGSSKEPMIKYALHINGHEIKQDDHPTDPTFKYSLSEGDKSALALSFFLTKLEVDGNLQDKIVVFDDPVSSFDLNRKSTTINKLLHFGQQAKQLFVLTHNIVFAGEFWKNANQISTTRQCSKIEYFGNSSCIVEYNIDIETLSSILKDSLAIKKYLAGGSLSDQERRGIARCLRPALESYFHLKFFDLVSPSDWLGDFISLIRNATGVDPYFRLQGSVQELTDINDYSKKYHHRFNSNNESDPVTDAELRNYCERTLRLIQLI
jgi:wobble nucleotide-excising tRNase